MITEILQPISCFISTKSEIPLDHAAPRARALRVGPRTALTATTHHLVNGIGAGSAVVVVLWALAGVAGR
jgi:hypothetical protein